MKSLGATKSWDPPALRTVAAQGDGITDLLDKIREHGVWLKAHGGFERKARERARLRFGALLAEEAANRARARAGEAEVERLIQAIADRHLDPYAAVEDVLGPRKQP